MPAGSKPPFERAEIGLTASIEKPSAGKAALRREGPFRILILGDFGGRESRGLREPGSLGFDRRPVRADRDEFDDLFDRLSVELRLRPGGDAGPSVTLRPRTLDDFHPDRIYESAHAFSGLRRLRDMLDDASTFDEAAAEIDSWGRARPETAAPPAAAAPSKAPRSTSEDVISELLAGAARRAEAPDTTGLDSFLHQIVKPHLASAEPRSRPDRVAAVESAVGAWMRGILHDPAFQALESAWRGLDGLLRRIESDEEIEVFLLDTSKAEAAEALRSAEDLQRSPLFRAIVESDGDGRSSVLAGLYTFDSSLEDVALLGRFARIARAANAPFLAAASARILGCVAIDRTPDPDDWRSADAAGDELWNALRGIPEASFLGLAMPRVLQRLPYGKDTDPVERFAFEEADGSLRHEDYLWGNPAFAVVAVLASEFSEFGWHLRPERGLELSGLPLHVRSEGGSVRSKPCAEALLTERAAARILDAGLMPLVSMKDRDAIRLLRIQSIARPPARLSGPWA
jgi:type VI secretion system protein ImpC